MLELGRKEPQLLSGIGVQIALVALLVFAYTQAIRQVKLQQELQARLQEQLALAREQVAKHGGKSDLLASLQAQVAEIKSFLITPSELTTQANRLKVLAENQVGVQNLQVKVGTSALETVSVPLEGRPDFVVEIWSLEMTGATTSRNAAGLMERIRGQASKVLCPLVAMELKASEPGSIDPVDFSFKWVVAVEPSPSGSRSEHLEVPSESPQLAWGWREEPFLSPLDHPNALRIPAERLTGFHLTGIVWDPAQSTCVINGEVLKPGDWIKGYQLVLLTRETVLLQGPEDELLLRLS